MFAPVVITIGQPMVSFHHRVLDKVTWQRERRRSDLTSTQTRTGQSYAPSSRRFESELCRTCVFLFLHRTCHSHHLTLLTHVARAAPISMVFVSVTDHASQKLALPDVNRDSLFSRGPANTEVLATSIRCVSSRRERPSTTSQRPAARSQ